MSLNASLHSSAETARVPLGLTPGDRLCAYAGAAILLLTPVVFALLFKASPPSSSPVADLILYRHALEACYAVMFGVLLAVFLLQPALFLFASRLRTGWRPLYTALGLLAACLFLCVFLVHEGRHQFGGFDFDIIVDTGWRQILGQRLYTDFVATTPPGFDLSIQYAFRLFGVSWNATLYFSALFACVTLLWMYWLLRQAGFGVLAAVGVAFAVESQTMLLLGYWWYNDSTLVLAAVFLLSCLAYLLRPESRRVQLSYIIALALFLLMKPNIAGIAIPGGVALLLIAPLRRWRLVVLSVGSLAAAVAILALNHISLPAMLSSYREASKYRGGFSLFGFLQMTQAQRIMAVLALASLSIPGLWVLPRIQRQLRRRDTRSVALLLFFPLALLLSAYALMTNGEPFWLVELPPLLIMASFFCFSENLSPPVVCRFMTAVLCASIAVSLCIGALRFRIHSIGAFFEWTNNENRIDGGFLDGMRVGAPMIEVERQITAAVHSNPGPWFFGPRLGFNYAVQHLPSPSHFPAWWHPGVAFGIDQEPGLIRAWQAHRFQTLIFLKDDYTFYPPELMNVIAHGYVRDDRYPSLTVYHRRPGSP